jgi:hypothetical protein
VNLTRVREVNMIPGAARKPDSPRSDGAAGGREAPAEPTSEKQMQTFRMPRDLIAFLRGEAERGNRDLTGLVIRCLEGIRSYFGLPAAATVLLEADRKALGMERLEYLLHVLYHRSLLLREKGAGFDGPNAVEPRRR